MIFNIKSSTSFSYAEREHTQGYVDARFFGVSQNQNTAEFVLKSYLEEGENFVKKLKGEFVILIYDKRKSETLIIRDRFGFKPFYYHLLEDNLYFSSQISELRKELLPKQFALNSAKIKTYLTKEKAYSAYSEDTFFEDIYAAIPGHIVKIKNGQKTISCFWDLQPEPYERLDEEQQITAFRKRFYDAVNSTIAEGEKLAAHLSGGIDSSSVCSVASDLGKAPATFHIDPGYASSDESQYILAVADKSGCVHTEVTPNTNVLASLQLLARIADSPELYPIPSAFHFAAAQGIRDGGFQRVLTGHDGDTVTAYGNGLFEEYLVAKRWQDLKYVLQQYGKERNLSFIENNWLSLDQAERAHLFVQYFVYRELTKLLKKKAILPFLSLLSSAVFRLNFNPVFLIKQGFSSLLIKRKYRVKTFFRADIELSEKKFLDASGLYEQLDEKYLPQLRAITNRNFITAIEQLYSIGRHFGHSYAFPFFDEDLIELSLAIPEAVKFGNGKGRDTIRRALKDVLPKEVLNRGTKTNFGEYGLHCFRTLYAQTKDMFHENHILWKYADRKSFQESLTILLDEGRHYNEIGGLTMLASRVLFLGVWLDELDHI